MLRGMGERICLKGQAGSGKIPCSLLREASCKARVASGGGVFRGQQRR